MTAISGLRGAHVKVFNRFTRRVGAWLPGFAVLAYTGRTTGRRYLIPVKVYRHGPDRVIALMYGRDVQWVKNVVAAGECELRVQRRTTRLTDPHVVADPSHRLIPRYARWFLALLRVDEFMTLRPATEADPPAT